MKRIVLLTLVACGSSNVPGPVLPPPPPPPVLTPSVAPAAKPVPIAVEQAADPPGAWLTRPPAKADFYVALDGICRYLRVEKAGNDAFAITTTVPYILTPEVAILARLTPAGLQDMSKGATYVAQIGGAYPDALFENESGVERMWSTSQVFKWEENHWTLAFENPNAKGYKARRRGYELPIVAWKGGFVAMSEWTNPGADPSVTADSDAGRDLITYRVPQADVAPLMKRGFVPRALYTFPSGELVTIGETGKSTRVRWLDAAGAAHEYAPAGEAAKGAVALEDTRLVFQKRTVARFDGTTFTTEGLAPDPPLLMLEPPTKDATVVASKWAYSKTAVWEHDGSGWKEKTLPAPAFGTSTARSISSFIVLPTGEVDFVVGYYEKGRGWRDPVLYHALVRSVRPAETLRCNEPDPENLVISSGDGFTSWPPLADDACTTPFVILGRKSKEHPPMVKDWPQLRAALKGKTALGDTIDLIEVRAGDRTFVGAATKTTAEARTLLDAVAKATPTRGEVVCASPTATSTFHVDVKTGKVRE